jgi:hypothetical protein
MGWIRALTLLRTPTPHISKCSGYSSALRMGCHSAGDVQRLGINSLRQSSSCYKGKWWAHPVLISTTGTCVTGKVGLQFRIDVRILLIRERIFRRSQWRQGLKYEPCLPVRTLGSWTLIPLEAWMFVCVYSVFSLFCLYVSIFRRADPPPKESYRLCIGLRNWESGQDPTKEL